MYIAIHQSPVDIHIYLCTTHLLAAYMYTQLLYNTIRWHFTLYTAKQFSWPFDLQYLFSFLPLYCSMPVQFFAIFICKNNALNSYLWLSEWCSIPVFSDCLFTWRLKPEHRYQRNHYSCLPMVDGSLRALRLLPPLKLVAMILLKVAVSAKISNQINQIIILLSLYEVLFI